MKKSRFLGFLCVLTVLLVTFATLFTFVGCKDNKNNLPVYKSEVITDFVKAEQSEDGYATIFVNGDSDLRILLLSDTQLSATNGYASFGGTNDRTFKLINGLLDSVKPDAVLIAGDIVASYAQNNWPLFKQLADNFEERELPWMPCYGNHDSQIVYARTEKTNLNSPLGQVTKQQLTDLLIDYNYCLLTDGDCEDGHGNYFVNIRDSQSKDIIYTVCLMDTVSNESATSDSSDYFRYKTPKQIEWYEKHINAISAMQYGDDRTADEVVKSFCVFHVSLPEFYTAYDLAWNNGEPTADYYYGHCMEGGVFSGCNFFEKAVELKSTTAMFAGHHHSNDYSVNYQGIRLTCGQHTSYSTYYRFEKTDDAMGNITAMDYTDYATYGDQRGGTLITLNTTENGTFTVVPQYASEVIPDYNDWAINYKQIFKDAAARGVIITPASLLG